jgi:hypothetical protein
MSMGAQIGLSVKTFDGRPKDAGCQPLSCARRGRLLIRTASRRDRSTARAAEAGGEASGGEASTAKHLRSIHHNSHEHSEASTSEASTTIHMSTQPSQSIC